VLVVSDFEHKCFNINFEVVLGLYEQVKTLLGSEQAKSAKEVLEWLGLLGLPVGDHILPFLSFLKWRNGRKIAEVTPLTDADKTGIVQVRIEGDGNSVQVHNHVYHLAENPKALRATRDAFLPLGHDGFDNLKLRQADEVVREIDAEEVDAIVKSCSIGIEEAKETMEPEIEVTPAWLSVYSPVYDLSAPSWRFRLGKDIIYADITATSIAPQAIARGSAGVDDAYQVKLEITTEFDAQGARKEPKYKILEVIRFVEAEPSSPRQSSLFRDD
jgi:hypothetical protein